MRGLGLRLALAGVLATLGMLAASGAAQAANACPTPSPSASSATGIDGMMPPPPAIQCGNQPTLAEQYPSSAYSFNVDPGAAVGSGGMNNLLSFLAGLGMDLLVVVVMVAGRVLEWTFTFDFLSPFGAPAQAEVHALFDNYFQPLIAGMGATVALWFFAVATAGWYAKATQGIGWFLLVLTVATFYAASPISVIQEANTVSSQAAQDVLGSVSSADPAMANRATDPQFKQGPTGDAALRRAYDELFHVLVFTPWSVAALGSVQSGQTYGQELLAKNAGVPGADAKFNHDFLDNSNVSQADKDWYNGNDSIWRAVIAWVALFIGLATAGMLTFLTGKVVWAGIRLLVRMMVAPAFLLAGLHPGWGRDLLLNFASGTLQVLVVKVGAALLVVTVLILTGATAAIPNWFIAATLELLVIAAAVWKGGWFVDMFRRQSKAAEKEAKRRTAELLKSARREATTEKRTSAREAAQARPQPARATATATATAGPATARAGANPQARAATTQVAFAEAGGAQPSTARQVARWTGHILEGASVAVTALAPEFAPITLPLGAAGAFLARKAGEAPLPASRAPMPAALPEPSPATARPARGVPASRAPMPAATPPTQPKPVVPASRQAIPPAPKPVATAPRPGAPAPRRVA